MTVAEPPSGPSGYLTNQEISYRPWRRWGDDEAVTLGHCVSHA